MKNIHVLPTENNSWICIKDGELINANDGGCMLGYDPPRWLTQHIYITSDEEIKKGDWCIDDALEALKDSYVLKYFSEEWFEQYYNETFNK